MDNIQGSKIYDLEERTAVFGENIIKFAQKIPKTPVTIPLINQIVRSGTSIGANYLEGDDAESIKDFIHKLGISRKESRETKHWLRMLAVTITNSELLEEKQCLLQESHEINLILSKIIRNKKEKEQIN